MYSVLLRCPCFRVLLVDRTREYVFEYIHTFTLIFISIYTYTYWKTCVYINTQRVLAFVFSIVVTLREKPSSHHPSHEYYLVRAWCECPPHYNRFWHFISPLLDPPPPIKKPFFLQPNIPAQGTTFPKAWALYSHQSGANPCSGPMHSTYSITDAFIAQIHHQLLHWISISLLTSSHCLGKIL